MANRIEPLDTLLGAALDGLAPVPGETRPPAAAAGLVLARDVVAAHPVPARPVALRAGLAVRALDLVGASPQAPVLMTARPAAVDIGDTLPEGCDAIVDAGAVTGSGTLFEILEAPAPGTHVRLAGHDLRAGAVLARQGARVTPELALACGVAGVEAVSARLPRFALDIAEGCARAWLAGRLARLGCVAAAADEAPALRIRDAVASAPGLALQPGETASISRDHAGVIVVEAPRRFDGMVAAFIGLVLPAVAALLGQEIAYRQGRLLRKVSSAIGMSEIVLLREVSGAFEPLGAGDITLAALAAADHAALVAPGIEGLDAGAPIAAISLEAPLRARPPDGQA